MNKYKRHIFSILCSVILVLFIYVLLSQNQDNRSIMEEKALLYVGATRFQAFEMVYSIYNPFNQKYFLKLNGKFEKERVYATIDKNGLVKLIFTY